MIVQLIVCYCIASSFLLLLGSRGRVRRGRSLEERGLNRRTVPQVCASQSLFYADSNPICGRTYDDFLPMLQPRVLL